MVKKCVTLAIFQDLGDNYFIFIFQFLKRHKHNGNEPLDQIQLFCNKTDFIIIGLYLITFLCVLMWLV